LETGGNDPPLLRWKVREHNDTPTLVLAPMRARAGPRAEQDPVYEWLTALDNAEEGAELGRLLYVGATRARRRLHLTAVATAGPDGTDWKRPPRGSALERVWDAIGDRPRPPQPFESHAADIRVPASRQDLVRLPANWR